MGVPVQVVAGYRRESGLATKTCWLSLLASVHSPTRRHDLMAATAGGSRD